jgi:phosphoglycerate dehydrogenase-like enzyme
MSKINGPIRLLVTEATTSPFARHVRDWADTSLMELAFPPDSAPESLVKLAPECEALLCYQALVSAALINAAPHLRFIQKHGLNCRNIALDAARERGIPVATQPLIRNITVAEHALGLMLACSRKLITGHQTVTEAGYAAMGLAPMLTSQTHYRANWAGITGMVELYRATAGIVGMGDIGIEIAKRCRVFGMNLVYHQRTRLDHATETDLNLSYAGLDELLATADFVMLALPHTPQTEGLINARTLALMKPTATLINMGRGGLVDEAALAHALQFGQIAMAALDVYQREPLPANSPLLKLPNVVLTPHLGGGSYRSWEMDMPASLANIQNYFAGT